MLGFVTSLRARALAHDWEHHVRLLDRMLSSCLAQTDPRCVVVVVCHDRPATTVTDPRVHFIEVDLPLPQRDFDDMTTDKGLKITIGAEWAIRNGCRHLMYVDADDLVSRHLSEYVDAHAAEAGWYFTDGFIYRYGDGWLTLSPEHHLTCGTCAIVRTDLLEFANHPLYRNGWMETMAASGHTRFRDVMAGRGHPLQPLPFPGSIYIQHFDSTVSTRVLEPRSWSPRAALRSLRDGWRDRRKRRPLSAALRTEFTIDPSIP